MTNDVEEFVTGGINNVATTLKKNIYDVVVAVIIVAILAASLHVFGLVDFSKNTWDTVSKFLMDWLPYFAAAMLLNNTLYQKGVFVGKSTKVYSNAVAKYSKTANDLSGDELDKMQDFCEKYNLDALRRLQTSLLKTQAISFEKFNDEFEIDGKIHKPLKAMTKTELESEYEEDTVKVILKAKKIKVKGINVNVLLGNDDVTDPTNIGETESQLIKSYNKRSIFTYILSTAVTSLIVINDISTWGWANLIAVVFKVAYLVAKTLMSYFDGYNNATVKMVNHYLRKSDILKEFKEWYSNRQ